MAVHVYLLLQLYKTLPNRFWIPFPNPAKDSLILDLLGAILPPPLTQIPLKIIGQMIFYELPKIWQKQIRDR